MTEFGLVSSHMSAASAAASDAAAAARAASGSDALASLAAALPGTTTAEIVPELGAAWETGIDGWSQSAAEFAESIDTVAEEGSQADSAAGWLLGGLQKLLGGS